MASEENIGKLHRIAQLGSNEVIEYENFRESLLRSIDKELDVDQVMIKMIEVSEGQLLGTYKSGVFIFSTDIMKSAEKLVYEENRRTPGTKEYEMAHRNEDNVNANIDFDNVTKEQLDVMVKNFEFLDRRQREIVLKSFETLSTEQKIQVADGVIKDFSEARKSSNASPETDKKYEALEEVAKFEKRKLILLEKLKDINLSPEEREALLPELIEISRIELFDKIKSYERTDNPDERAKLLKEMAEMTGLEENAVRQNFLSHDVDLSAQMDAFLEKQATMYLIEISKMQNITISHDYERYISDDITKWVMQEKALQSKGNDGKFSLDQTAFGRIISSASTQLSRTVTLMNEVADIIRNKSNFENAGQLEELISQFQDRYDTVQTVRSSGIIDLKLLRDKAAIMRHNSGKSTAGIEPGEKPIGTDEFVEIFDKAAVDITYHQPDFDNSLFKNEYKTINYDVITHEQILAIEEQERKAKEIVSRGSHKNAQETEEIREIVEDKIEKRMDDDRKSLPLKESLGTKIKRGLFNIKKKVTSMMDSLKKGGSKVQDSIDSEDTSNPDTSSTSNTLGQSNGDKNVQAPVDYLNTQYKLNFKQAAQDAKMAAEKSDYGKKSAGELTQDEEQL